jgi:hypothetical protein
MANAEQDRLTECSSRSVPWKKWGPYLSDRQWGTVREDYSADGDAWNYFSHDQARSRAFRWGEDGIGGISDDRQRVCFALALWNRRDPILKERYFGLTNAEGNHGEDVKEYYYYLDSTPTHSYMKFLYKYPQAVYPYVDLVETNRRRSRLEPEYELIDTGIFDDDRYYDVFVEYAKAGPEDILIRITAANRGPDAAELDLLPTVWFRNTWSSEPGIARPSLRATDVGCDAAVSILLPESPPLELICEGRPALLFTENETNCQRLFGTSNPSAYVKDGINDCVVGGNGAAVNPNRTGTKAAAHYVWRIPAGQSCTARLRLRTAPATAAAPLGLAFDLMFDRRRREADEFYGTITPAGTDDDERLILRQAMAGMLWSKQHYSFDLDRWLREHGHDPLFARRTRNLRNVSWAHMDNEDIISMPDKWEYPWYAVWDLGFHAVVLAMVDIDFAKSQLRIVLSDSYLHPSGQLPAYEWNFSDVNPPVHAWAVLAVYQAEKSRNGTGDLQFLETGFRKLLLNFTWWVNRKDRSGNNIFEGGFLGLDNIGVFDRSQPLPSGGYLEQADGTAWMAIYCEAMLSIALELVAVDQSYEDIARKFLDHFFQIAGAMDPRGEHDDELWDQEDGFFYDVLNLPDGSSRRLKVRSMVGLLPLCAVSLVPGAVMEKCPSLLRRIQTFFARSPELGANLHPADRPGVHGHYLLSVVTEEKLRRILARMLDEERFLAPHGIRSLSKFHERHPYRLALDGQEYTVAYEPAESSTSLFGGNSNWRGPIWFPVNALIIRSLIQLYQYYGDELLVECPTGSGQMMTLFEVAREISNRLVSTFRRNAEGRRPVFGGAEKFQKDPHWRDYLLFYEYFHGDNGAGIGASHQTGWTGLAARLIQLFRVADAERSLKQPGTGILNRGA